MNIIEFLLARLDEDDLAARACGIDPAGGAENWPVQWKYTRNGDAQVLELMKDSLPDGMLYRSWQGPGRGSATIITHWEEDGQHIARHDPARVRREVAAKRKMIELLAEQADTLPGDSYWVIVDDGCWEAKQALACLASVYSAHPDYDQSWSL